MSETWFFWDPATNIVVFVLAIIVYYLLKNHPDTPEKLRKAAYGLGLCICLLSFFVLGLWMIGTVLLYVTSVYSINYWIERRKQK